MRRIIRWGASRGACRHGGMLMLLALAAGGCASAFTRENFDRVVVGSDDREDVARLLGDPEFRLDAEWYYENKDKHYAARIHWGRDGKVSGKQWYDANRGEIVGDHPDADPAPEGEVRERRVRTRRLDGD
jgi:hypothetical protein